MSRTSERSPYDVAQIAPATVNAMATISITSRAGKLTLVASVLRGARGVSGGRFRNRFNSAAAESSSRRS